MDMYLVYGFLRLLTDKQLAELMGACDVEESIRVEQVLNLRTFEPMTDAELGLLESAKLKALMAYRERTGCSVKFARRVMDLMVDEAAAAKKKKDCCCEECREMEEEGARQRLADQEWNKVYGDDAQLDREMRGEGSR